MPRLNHVGAVMFAVVATLGCGQAPGPGQYDARDVRGNYALTWADRVTAKLDVGGAVREVTQSGPGAIIDFGTINGQPTQLDVAAFCARPEVQCPSEVFWKKVAIDQPDLAKSGATLQTLRVIDDTAHVLDAGQRAAAVAGLVNHADGDTFVVGLGAAGGASSACVALGLSLAGGRFSRVGERFETTLVARTSSGKPCSLDGGASDAGVADAGASDAGPTEACAVVPVRQRVVPPRAEVAGIVDGRVVVGYAGGCAFGPVIAGATLTLETPFSGTRTGVFDPPPYVPAPVTLPDAGLLGDGGVFDAGASPDGGP